MSWRAAQLALLVSMVSVHGASNAMAAELAWTRLADLPDPVGLKGMYAGVSGERVILAGGSNFPRPLREGGTKTYHDRIFIRDVAAPDDAAWAAQDEGLPQAMAEGTSVTTEHGVVGLGGLTASGPTARVFLLQWEPSQRRVIWSDLPPLPQATAHAAAAVVNNRIYVAGGDNGTGDSQLFVWLDIEMWIRAPAAAAWQTLPPWPGPARFGAVLQPIPATGGGQRLLLAGGKAAKAGYLADAYAFDVVASTWKRLPDLPRPALLAASLGLPNRDVAVLGGSDGQHSAGLAQLGDRYRLPAGISIYRATDNRWESAAEMPLGVVGAAVAPIGRSWLLAGGEYSPGLRTPQTHRIELRKAPAERDR